ncbi:hypothetical protein PRUPE_2G122800 [Prunus persica]|uniref:Uncharacterized protein n=1 Tax=Prunus persica TaxID=3760 RepID=A0A251QES7_PRUPE|nr:hypothetical protein PRUPE_2G122800 [Prunus persica]
MGLFTVVSMFVLRVLSWFLLRYDLQFVWVSKDYDFAHRMLLLTIGMFCGPLLWVYYLGFLWFSHVGLLCWSLIAVLVGGFCVRFCF